MKSKHIWLGAFVVAVLAALTTVAMLLRDPLPYFLARRSSIATIREASTDTVGASRTQAIHIVAKSGLAVDVLLRRHRADSTRRLPLVVILGGHVTGAEAARLIGETPGVMIAAVSYPFTGDPRPSAATFIRELPKIRGAFLDTPPALMLALDYLLTRPDVDSTQVDAVGVSLGAPFVVIAGSLDKRFTRVWALHGSGGSYAPLESSMRRSIRFAPLRAGAAALASIVIDGPRLAPERWVAGIAPRPFIMVNATNDERMPRKSVDALYRAAAQPKELLWMSGRHIHGDARTIQSLVAVVMQRVHPNTNKLRT